MKGLRIGVVGVGHMGRRHAEKILALAEAGTPVSLSGVADADPERARRVAAELGVPAAPDLAALFGGADAVVAAVPTVHHFELVRAALEAGLDVLVEKPIAETLAEAEALVALASRLGRVLHVGHLERYNAATRALRGRIHRPRFADVQRIGPFPDRGTDVDVVRDLMIHDIDILQQLLGEEPDRVEAVGVAMVTDKIDLANARLGFPSGCVADLTASRVSAAPARRMRLFQGDGFVAIDFLAQSASIHRRVPERVNGEPHVAVEQVVFDPEDALLSQLRVFVDAVRKRAEPSLSAASALGALRTAVRVVEAMPEWGRR